MEWKWKSIILITILKTCETEMHREPSSKQLFRRRRAMGCFTLRYNRYILVKWQYLLIIIN